MPCSPTTPCSFVLRQEEETADTEKPMLVPGMYTTVMLFYIYFIKQRMLNYWANLVNGKQSKFSFIVYSLLKDLYDQGEYQSKWLSCISDNLNGMGLGYLWNAQEFSTNWFKHTINQISKDTSVQNLRSDITESGHCQTYRTLKCNMELEPYLTLLDKKYAIPLCKFRAGNNKLPIVTGRHKNTPRNERFCLLCPDRKKITADR